MFDVYLNDNNLDLDASELLFHNACEWAQDHCQSFYGHEIVDVSDFSYQYNSIALYQFGLEKDAVMFGLRWK